MTRNTETTWRGKHLADGARTLSEIADRLRLEASRLLLLSETGWRLLGPVDDDYGFMRRPTAPKKKRGRK